jgi:hypothetical protein
MIDSEQLSYALHECDVRSDEQGQRDAARGALAGDLRYDSVPDCVGEVESRPL